MGTAVDEKAVEEVYEAWRAGQANPDLCTLTKGRRDLIGRSLKRRGVRDLIALMRYAYEADEAEPRFWRGINRDKRAYLGLDNLLRITKLDDRCDNALGWTRKNSEHDQSVDLGPTGAIRRAIAARDSGVPVAPRPGRGVSVRKQPSKFSSALDEDDLEES